MSGHYGFSRSPEIAAYYETFAEEARLTTGASRLVDEARKRNEQRSTRIASLTVGDARALPQADRSADALLVMGPLYHLTEAADRAAALREAFRVLAAGGIVAVAAISRYASALDGMARRLTRDPRFVEIRNRDLADGQHRNDTERVDYFTTAYFHRPEDLHVELEAAGFTGVNILGVEGPSWAVPDFDSQWDDRALRQELLDVARRLESEASIIGASAHLLWCRPQVVGALLISRPAAAMLSFTGIKKAYRLGRARRSS